MPKGKKLAQKPPSVRLITEGDSPRSHRSHRINRARIDRAREDLFLDLIDGYGTNSLETTGAKEDPTEEELRVGLILALSDTVDYHLSKISDGSLRISKDALSLLAPLRDLSKQINQIIPERERTFRTFRLQ